MGNSEVLFSPIWKTLSVTQITVDFRHCGTERSAAGCDWPGTAHYLVDTGTPRILLQTKPSRLIGAQGPGSEPRMQAVRCVARAKLSV